MNEFEYLTKKQQNKRDLIKLVVLSIFTITWLIITIVNNAHLSKKAESASTWGNSIIEQNDKMLKSQSVIIEQNDKILKIQSISFKDQIAIMDKLKSVQKSVDNLEKIPKQPILISPKNHQ